MYCTYSHSTSPSPMASLFPKHSLLVALLLLLVAIISASALTPELARPVAPNLAERLQADALMQCWNSLMELRSCTGEVILFFLNGEAYLGPSCCRAIRVIEHRCWAAEIMLQALGFTPREGDVLRGYCDAEAPPARSHPPPPPPPAQAPAPEYHLHGH
ncbi:egg cell-secreted protein 1.4-like [Canna indica]|uniref:Egg cell-secreted protein 1.4-like n=1 Tax=Canna indica TaxID=4628 RepID=A0AAQ3QHL3_9LILI|nr:egg cell-secreted protein 1.4-like [Canna indica]